MTTECDATATSASSTSYYFYFLLAAQALNAIGGSAAFTLAIPYMDTQIKTRDTPLYIGEMLVISTPRGIRTTVQRTHARISITSLMKTQACSHVVLCFFAGIMQGFAAFGPAMGFILGGVFLKIYVDFNRMDTSELVL